MIKSGFENLSIVQKVQLYLLAPMLCWILLFVIEYTFTKKHRDDTLNKIKSVNIEKNKIEQISPNKVVKFIENKRVIYNVSLHTIHIKQKLISIQISGLLENCVSFLQKLQSHLDIVGFKVLRDDNLLTLNITINSRYFFNKNFLEKEFITKYNNTQVKSGKIKIDAIVGDEVLLDNLWYKKDTEYNNYKIIEIGKSFILLRDLQSKLSFRVELLNEPL